MQNLPNFASKIGMDSIHILIIRDSICKPIYKMCH